MPTCKRLHGLSEAEVALAVLAADVDFLRPGESLLRRLCGCAAGAGRREGAERLERASTHWMRHSHASHAIAAGMPIEIAQQNLGHASLSMTTVYVTTESKRRMKAVERFWKR